jgi:putative CocE/NonD family hydrolase
MRPFPGTRPLSVALALLVAAGAARRVDAQAIPPRYDSVSVVRDLMIPVKDGTLMATDLYRPVKNGVLEAAPLPVLLNRTPYDRVTLAAQARYFALRGYVVAVQNLRGRYNSGGTFLKVQPEDAPDGRDVIQWLAAQPWSNGKVGMWGQSFAAHSQAGAAQMKPPALSALLLNMGGLANGWDHGVRYRGTYEMGRQITWAWSQLLADAKRPEVKAVLEREKVEDWYGRQPMKRGLNPLSVEPTYEGWYLDFFEHADYDAFWKDKMVNWSEHYDETADIPMLHVGGWYDIFLAGTFQNFSELGRRHRTPQRLMVGPWTHSGNTRAYAGDVSFGPEAGMEDFPTTFHVRWFDHWLRGEANGVDRDAPVRLFVMGLGDGHKDADGRLFHGGTWKDYPSWPVPGTRLVPYYFHGDGGLRTAKPTAAASSTTYTFDPAHPVPTIGGGSSARLKDGAYDQREDPRFPPSAAPWLPLRSRPDVVSFQTEPLTEDVTVIGPITVVLHASSNRTDTDFTAKLVDVYPPSVAWPGGFDLNLTDAIVRGRYRATRDHQVLLTPGKVEAYTILPFPTANVFKKGHRIRVDISSSNFPRFDVNPGTGEPLGKNRRMVTQDNTVYHSARYPSHIVLPLAPGVR